MIFGPKTAKKLDHDMEANFVWAQASPSLCVFNREAVQSWTASQLAEFKGT
jgi:hypothetical protein